MSLPEAVANDDDGSRSMLEIYLADLPTELGRISKQGEKVRRHPVALDAFGTSFARQVGVPVLSRRQMFEGRALFSPIPKVGGRSFDTGCVLLGDGFPYSNHAIEIRNCKRPENQSVYVTEDRRIGP